MCACMHNLSKTCLRNWTNHNVLKVVHEQISRKGYYNTMSASTMTIHTMKWVSFDRQANSARLIILHFQDGREAPSQQCHLLLGWKALGKFCKWPSIHCNLETSELERDSNNERLFRLKWHLPSPFFLAPVVAPSITHDYTWMFSKSGVEV